MVLIVFYRGRQIVKSGLNIIVLEFEATVTYDRCLDQCMV